MIKNRNAVRAILLTPENEILLMRIHAPQGGDPFWIAPGGGMEDSENVESALRRELREELGLLDFTIGALVWRRQHTFNWGDVRLCQREQFYIVHTNRFVPHMTDQVEAQVLEQFRWWRIADLARTSEQLTPRSLADIVERYLRDGAPLSLPDVEVLVD